MKLNRDLITRFRDKMNEPCILRIFRDHNGRAEWNVICSAMDWIETAVEGIDTDTLSRDNSSDASIRMITFISCVDILWRGICQLHRVFIGRDSIPFKTDDSIFQAHCPDNQQFENIRAIFAAHPVDLRNIYGGGEDERWFASWSGGTFSNQDFGVFLYSNKPGVLSRPFDIRFKEVYRFAKTRYDYLNDLMDAAERHIEQYSEKLREESIEADKDDVLPWINKLIEENHRRWDFDFINYDLETARDAFLAIPRSEQNKQVLDQYRLALLPQLHQIHSALQSMNRDPEVMEIRGDYPEHLMHPMEKLFTADDDDPIFRYGVDAAQEYLNGIVDLNIQESIREIQVMAQAGLWVKETNTYHRENRK